MTPLPDAAGHAAVANLSAPAVKRGLQGGGEIALLDVREPREFSNGHPFFAVSVPFSRFEPELCRLVPNPHARIVLVDDGDSGRAQRAARIAVGLGYRDVALLDGGTEAWRKAGYNLFEGENVPSKVFGELLQEACHVPCMAPAAFEAQRRTGEKFLLLDGRPFDEHRKMCIPGSISLPNGDLAYRIALAANDDTTPIVVHCAGRTRGIVGAETLRRLELKNPIAALADGTQGWMLAGLTLEHGSERRVAQAPDEAAKRAQQKQAWRLAERWAVPSVDADALRAMVGDRARTTYVFDVRSPEEFTADPAGAIQNAPGGQLVQATDRWLAVRDARIVLVDDTEVRAAMCAHWLRQMGWDAAFLAGGRDAWPALTALPMPPRHDGEKVPAIPAADLVALHRASQAVAIFDLRPSASFRRAHIEGSEWSTRARLAHRVAGLAPQTVAVLVAEDDVVAGLVAADLRASGHEPRRLAGSVQDWTDAGLQLVASPTDCNDDIYTDVSLFMPDRHAGNPNDARGYLAWEQGLVDRLDDDERATFRITADAPAAP